MVKTAGKAMGLCITEIADYICHKIEGYSYVVVTDHKKIINFRNKNNKHFIETNIEDITTRITGYSYSNLKETILDGTIRVRLGPHMKKLLMSILKRYISRNAVREIN